MRIAYLLFNMWCVHGVLWYVIIQHFIGTVKEFNECELGQTVPDGVIVLVWSQFILFSAFGVVQTGQFVVMCWSPFAPQTNIWRLSALLYSILSISAKTSLDISFIAGIVNT